MAHDAHIDQPAQPYKELLYSPEQVDARVAEMAAEIIQRYDPRNTVFVALLNGAMPFAAKLMHAVFAAKH